MKRKFVVALFAVALVGGSASAGSSGRTVERTYQPAYLQPGNTGSLYSSNGVTFRTKAKERFVSVTIEDDSGLQIPARITQGADEHPEHEYDVDQEFCGSTSEPIAIQGGEPVTVWMSHGTCGDGQTAGGWTTGTVAVTLSR